ncbi:DMAC1 protein, partial [Geococcyx californianus]|nr:DMAC1 protein [Geococcyx californianus]
RGAPISGRAGFRCPAMSGPQPPVVPVRAEPPRPLFGGCWSCRLLCGTGLLAAALWIYQGPRRSLKRGIPPSMASIAQITLAISEWGGG